MINVSSSFKEAIKSENREIYGYVEVKYQDNEYDLEVLETPTISEVVTSNGLVGGEKILNKLASLEDNYTLLDGSFMVWNENRPLEYGFISDDVFEDINDSTIIIQNNTPNTLVKGITIYFKENLPFDFDFTLTYSDNTTEIHSVRNNTSMTYQYIFSEEMSVSTITLEVLRVEKPENRLRLAYIDFNISDLYEGDELVSFDVDEEIDLLFETVPVNTCVVNLNNYPNQDGGNKFDPINPTGIVNYLNDNVTVKPFIGVLTEENGIEYVSMGIFYLEDWSSENDGNVTMTCKNLISKLETTNIISDGNYLSPNHSAEYYNSYFNNITGYTFNLVSTFNIHQFYLRTINLMNWLRCYTLENLTYNSENDTYNKQQLHVTRNNIVTNSVLSDTLCDKISRKELKEDVKYITKKLINKVEIIDTDYTQQADISNKKVVDANHILKKDVEYVWFQFDDMASVTNFSYSVVSGSGSAELIDQNFFMVYIKFTGTVGSEIKVTCIGQVHSKTSENTLIFTNDLQSGETLKLNFDQYWLYSIRYRSKDIANYCLTKDKKYKISLETMGDPSLEVGDTISIQTRYQDINDGYKDIIITKQHFSYDGGLSCTIEGEGD